MKQQTLIVGGILIIIGILGYLASGMIDGHYAGTALIPAYIGIVLAILGILAATPKMRMHVMHVAVLLGLIGCLMSLWRIIGAVKAGSLNGVKIFSLGGTTLVTGIFVVLCVRSFIAARKARKANE